ncbi:hypothetical protein [Kitasatospora sp. NPDC101183]
MGRSTKKSTKNKTDRKATDDRVKQAIKQDDLVQKYKDKSKGGTGSDKA